MGSIHHVVEKMSTKHKKKQVETIVYKCLLNTSKNKWGSSIVYKFYVNCRKCNDFGFFL